MSNKDKTTNTKPETEIKINEEALIAALNKLFTEEKWELPDDCIVGPFKHKIDQLQARVDHLTRELVAMRAGLNDEPARILDALAAVKGKK